MLTISNHWCLNHLRIFKNKQGEIYLFYHSLALIKYIAADDKLDKVLENPKVIKTPVVRNGKQSTLGYLPDVWKNWN